MPLAGEFLKVTPFRQPAPTGDRSRESLFGRCFLAVRGSVVPRIAPQIISVALLSALVVWAQQRD